MDQKEIGKNPYVLECYVDTLKLFPKIVLFKKKYIILWLVVYGKHIWYY